MHTPQQFKVLVEAANAGNVEPIVSATYPLAVVREAQEQFALREHVGKIVLLP